MKIRILDKVLEYGNKQFVYNDFVEEVNKSLKKSNLIFSHLVIDGKEVYEDFNNFISNNIENIKEINVIAKTEKEISTDIILSTIDYLDRAVPEIDKLSNEFYKTPSQASWNKLIDLIDGIRWIIDSFITIDSNADLKSIVNSYEEWNLYAKDVYSLKELLSEFEDILENSDYVSVADILSYEIVPLFKSMEEKLKKSILVKVEAENA